MYMIVCIYIYMYVFLFIYANAPVYLYTNGRIFAAYVIFLCNKHVPLFPGGQTGSARLEQPQKHMIMDSIPACASGRQLA